MWNHALDCGFCADSILESELDLIAEHSASVWGIKELVVVLGNTTDLTQIKRLKGEWRARLC